MSLHRRSPWLLDRKHAVDAWVRAHLREFQVAIAVLGVVLIASAAFVIFDGPSGKTRLAKLPPPVPSPQSSTAPFTFGTSTAPSSTHARSHSSSSSSSGGSSSHITCNTTSHLGAGGSVPVHICIPAIGVNADVMQLGLNADRTVQVPPLSQVGTAGWYKYSPAPGVIGPSIILGHIDSAQYGKGVFFDLGRLHSGDTVTLTRADARVATFRIDKVEEYPKSHFPTQTVYGNTSDAAVRLITCGGQFDASSGNYLDNIVAFGTLVSLKGPSV